MIKKLNALVVKAKSVFDRKPKLNLTQPIMLSVKYEDFKINLGDKVSDNISGFSGVVVSATQWLHNCNTYSVKPTKLLKGVPIENQSFDELMLTVIERDFVKADSRNNDFKFELGDTVKSVMEGYTGIITARCKWFTGCNNYSLKSTELNHEGKPTDNIWYEQDNLILVAKNPWFEQEEEVKQAKQVNTGGPVQQCLPLNR